MIESFRPSQVAAFRLARHYLLDRSPAADLWVVTEAACGIQAQVMAAAEIALWARTHEQTRSQIHKALWEARTLVKTSCMRGTIHLLTAADFPVYIGALKRSRVQALRALTLKQGVTQGDVDSMNEAILDALKAGPLTRRELNERIASVARPEVMSWVESPWGFARDAVVEGLVCWGPDRGQESTFVRVDQWLSEVPQLPAGEAAQILVRRYLAAYGPATPRDFAKWSGMHASEVRNAWEPVKDEMDELDIDGQRRWLLRADLEVLRESGSARGVLRLLPTFDPYLLGHSDTAHLVASSFYKRVYRKAGWISSVVLLDGGVVGVWSYARRGKPLLVTVEPFENLSNPVRTMIEEEVDGLGRFLGTEANLEFVENEA